MRDDQNLYMTGTVVLWDWERLGDEFLEAGLVQSAINKLKVDYAADNNSDKK